MERRGVEDVPRGTMAMLVASDQGEEMRKREIRMNLLGACDVSATFAGGRHHEYLPLRVVEGKRHEAGAAGSSTP